MFISGMSGKVSRRCGCEIRDVRIKTSSVLVPIGCSAIVLITVNGCVIRSNAGSDTESSKDGLQRWGAVQLRIPSV